MNDIAIGIAIGICISICAVYRNWLAHNITLVIAKIIRFLMPRKLHLKLQRYFTNKMKKELEKQREAAMKSRDSQIQFILPEDDNL